MTREKNSASLQDVLLKKTGKAAGFLAGTFLLLSENSRIPTVSRLSEEGGFSRGTVQNALNQLERLGAVELESHGHLGTYLRKRDVHRLVEATGRQYISGLMPMPYTRAYEGLATGLFNSIAAHEGISVDIAYMRGSRKRIASLMEGKYDFAVVSRFAVKLARQTGSDIAAVLDFGAASYLAGHVMVFRSNQPTSITPGLRVGLDATSYDHKGLTERVVGDIPVQYISVNYGQIPSLLQEGVIDAALCNLDQITESAGFYTQSLALDEATVSDEVSAVLAVRESDRIARALVREFVDPVLVKKQQQEVMQGERYPNY